MTRSLEPGRLRGDNGLTPGIRTVGMIGLGAMGRPMSRHLIDGGYAVVGYDPDEAACRAAGAGLRPLASPKAVARESDLVIVVVGFEEQVDAVLFGEDGVLAGGRPGLVVGIGSTVSPAYARELPGRVGDDGVALLDMPLIRSAQAAEAGTMLILCGADETTFTTCKPVLERFATDVVHLGPCGSGQVGKMINNMILWACMAANDEGLRLGEALGLDPERLRDALKDSSAANFALVERADTRPIPWAEKDMVIAQGEADRLRIPIPLAGLVKELIKDFKRRRGYPTPSART